MSSHHLVSTVLSTHRRCVSDGNSFDVETVMNNFKEHVAVKSANRNNEDQTRAMFDSGLDMQFETDNSDSLQASVENLRECGEQKLIEMLFNAQQELNAKNNELQEMSRWGKCLEVLIELKKADVFPTLKHALQIVTFIHGLAKVSINHWFLQVQIRKLQFKYSHKNI